MILEPEVTIEYYKFLSKLNFVEVDLSGAFESFPKFFFPLLLLVFARSMTGGLLLLVLGAAHAVCHLRCYVSTFSSQTLGDVIEKGRNFFIIN